MGGVAQTNIEEDGFERVQEGGKYYLIGGGANHGHDYSMWVFQSEHIGGPYEPLVEGFMLNGANVGSRTWLASWCRGPSGVRLLSNYFSPLKNDVPYSPASRAEVWMLP